MTRAMLPRVVHPRAWTAARRTTLATASRFRRSCEPPSAPRAGFDEPLDRVSIAVLIGVGLLFLSKAFLAIDSAFEVDEFDTLHRAQEFLAGPAVRLATPHRLLSVVVFSLGAAMGAADPVIGLVVNRAVAVAANIVLYLAVLRIAGRLFGQRAGIHALVGLGMVFVLLDHAYTARTDVLSMTLYAAALALLLERRAALRVLAGVALGLAFFLSLKSCLMTAAVGAGLVAALLVDRRRGGRDLLLFAAGFAAVHVLYWVLRAALAAPPEIPLDEPLGRMQAYAAGGTGVARRTLYLAALRHNPLFAALAAVGLAGAWARWWAHRGRTEDVDTRRLRLLVLTAVTAYLGAMLLYPHPWPYFLATAVPGLAVFWGALCGAIHRRLAEEPARSPLVAGALTVLVVAGFARPADRVRAGLAMDNGYQLAVMDRLEAVVGPGDTYFDGVGLAPNLPRASEAWLDVITLQGLAADADAERRLIETLAEGRTAAVVVHWRTDQLPDAFQAFRRAWFVQDWGNVFVPGRAFETARLVGAGAELPALTAGTYHVRGADGAWRALRIDGVPLTGARVQLDAGVHRIAADADVGPVKLLRLPEDFEETRAPLDAYKPLFPKERYLLSR